MGEDINQGVPPYSVSKYFTGLGVGFLPRAIRIGFIRRNKPKTLILISGLIPTTDRTGASSAVESWIGLRHQYFPQIAP